MKYDCVNPELLKTMERILLEGGDELRVAMEEFIDETGQISRPSSIRMWRGASLESFSIDEILALFSFLRGKFDIGSENEHFFSIDHAWDKRKSDEKKNKYLETLDDETQKRSRSSMLRRVEIKMEQAIQKDICDMSAKDLLSGFENMGYVNRRSAGNDISLVKHYLNWCLQQGYSVPAASEIQKIKPSDISIKKSLWDSIVQSPERLNDVVKTVWEWSIVPTGGVVVCLYWLGLTFEEIYNLLSENVDLKNSTIQDEHFGSIQIPDEIVNIFKEYKQTDAVYTEKHVRIADKTIYFVQRYIPEGSKSKGERFSPNGIRSLVTKFKKSYFEASGQDMKITGKNLANSGACWRLYQRETAGEVLDDKVFGYERRISSSVDIENFKRLYKEYKEIFYGA